MKLNYSELKLRSDKGLLSESCGYPPMYESVCGVSRLDSGIRKKEPLRTREGAQRLSLVAECKLHLWPVGPLRDRSGQCSLLRPLCLLLRKKVHRCALSLSLSLFGFLFNTLSCISSGLSGLLCICTPSFKLTPTLPSLTSGEEVILNPACF